jgi:hypothetical protein
MLATILVHVSLAIAPLMSPPLPPSCELDVLTPLAIEERSLGEFNHRIEAYLTLRRRLARTLPPSEMFDDEDSFVSDELRSALVAARPGARAGEFFTPGVERSLRQRLDVALVYTGGSALPFRHDEGVRATINRPLPIMTDLFAWGAGDCCAAADPRGARVCDRRPRPRAHRRGSEPRHRRHLRRRAGMARPRRHLSIGGSHVTRCDRNVPTDLRLPMEPAGLPGRRRRRAIPAREAVGLCPRQRPPRRH